MEFTEEQILLRALSRGDEKACQFWRQRREEFNVILVTDDGKIHISENLKENFQTECDLEMIESGSE